MGNWQIGTATQMGFLLLIIGCACLFRPYQTAKWHKNDPDIRRREHKRIQSHRRKSQRVEFDSAAISINQEPSHSFVTLVRVLGALFGAVGLAILLWSFL
jgi:hypothetical protein